MTDLRLGPTLTEESAPGTGAAERALLTTMRMLAETARANVLAGIDPSVTGWRYHHWGALLLDVGRLFRPGTLPPEVEPREPGTCWRSAHETAEDHGLIYVEGITTSTRNAWLDTEHGWCARPDEADALDPTWRPPGSAYLGVPFTAEFRAHALACAGSPNLFSTAHEFGRSLLYDGLPAGAVQAGTGRPVPAAARLR